MRPEKAASPNAPKGAFEKFRSDWLLQVAADRLSKSAAPLAIVLGCRHLNRQTGTSWPGVETLVAATGADASNTVRNALKLLEARGHIRVDWTKGGKGKTNIVTPLVSGKPFKILKGIETDQPFKSMEGLVRENPSSLRGETLQFSDRKPFKKLKGNHLKEPIEEADGPSRADPPTTFRFNKEDDPANFLRNVSDHQPIDGASIEARRVLIHHVRQTAVWPDTVGAVLNELAERGQLTKSAIFGVIQDYGGSRDAKTA
ncbi:helix-turn-helix domain-containing protein [Rhizobium laguerreae]|uniref:helix-turn-helix domain-containing protein n=1 Tax=Rhizobium laguerreae TaxID=1076926 RepID=UPI001C90338C|nr:helix-turn-helix domain-containing protein [Rhizobium laguerreae]MBY3312225.1 hypothetical protein [Rhizobium laguerreae]